jgi:integrase/recombinase XerD
LKNLSPRTIEEYQKVLGSLFKYLKLGDSSPGEITVPQLWDYVASMQRRGLAAKTVSNHVLVIKRFFGFLLAEEYVQEDPSRRLPRPKVGRRLPKAVTIPQVQALFAAIGSESRAERRDKMLFQLIYAGGLRVSEAVGLKVDDIDFTQGALMVVGKGDKERRIYLKPFVLKQLQRHITENGLTGYLFPGRGDSHITARNVQMRFKEYVRKADLPEHISPHTRRHSIAVHYLVGGAPITFVQGLLGHESPSLRQPFTSTSSVQATKLRTRLSTSMREMQKKISENSCNSWQRGALP